VNLSKFYSQILALITEVFRLLLMILAHFEDVSQLSQHPWFLCLFLNTQLLQDNFNEDVILLKFDIAGEIQIMLELLVKVVFLLLRNV